MSPGQLISCPACQVLLLLRLSLKRGTVFKGHAICRDLPSYPLRLPSKRIFSQQQSVEFVEERRQQLNGYLQSLLAIPPVASNAQHHSHDKHTSSNVCTKWDSCHSKGLILVPPQA